MQPTPIFLPGKSHGQRSLAGYSPWAHKESDTTKFLRTQAAAATAAKLLQSCPTLCDPIDGSPPGSPVPGILQARTLEWVAISFSNAWKWKVKVKSLSRVRLLAIPWTAAHQAPWSMGFSRQEYWSGVPLAHTNKQTMPSFTQHIGSTSWETGKVNLKCYWGSENIPRFKNIFLYLLHFWHSAL